MNTQNNIRPGSATDADRSTERNEEEKASQISLPKNDEARGPFDHSGETSRQTEEQQEEEQEEKQ